MEWKQLGLDIGGEAAGDNSGGTVSLSADGTRVAIGAQFNDEAGTNAGHVRVYQFLNDAWSKIGDDIDGEAAGDNSGSVRLSGDGSTVAIGARGNDGTGTGTDAGHVRVYKFLNDAWSKIGDDIDGEATEDYSGTSVSLSYDGTVVAISAPSNDGTSGSTSDFRGHVRVYQFLNDAWSKIGDDIDGEAAGDNSGASVSLSGNGLTVAIGAIGNDGTTGTATDGRGHVRVYEFLDEAWSKIGDDIDGEAAGDFFGAQVSLSYDGSRVAIGAPNNDGTTSSATDGRGHVRVYELNGTAWAQLGLDIDGEAAGDVSGGTVSLSADGTRVAIGARNNDGTTGTATDGRGHVRVYEFLNNAWVQLGLDIDGEEAGDFSGSVSLSGDGSRVAIGARNNDGTGTDAGHVRVYQLVSTTTTTTTGAQDTTTTTGAQDTTTTTGAQDTTTTTTAATTTTTTAATTTTTTTGAQDTTTTTTGAQDTTTTTGAPAQETVLSLEQGTSFVVDGVTKYVWNLKANTRQKS